MMIYGSVSTGYKAGSVQDGGKTYKPETLTNFEFGTKNSFDGGKIKWNNAVYYSDFKDFQFSSPVLNPDGTHSFLTSNAEGAKVAGFESELSARLTPDDKLQGTVAFTHTKLGSLIGLSHDYNLPSPCALIPGVGDGCVDVTGHKLAHAPSFSATVQYAHTLHMDDGATWTPRLSLHYETESWLSIFNYGEMDKQKAYTRTDLGLRYANAKRTWYVEGFVRNLENANIKTSAAGGPTVALSVAQYMAPRTFGINAGIDF